MYRCTGTATTGLKTKQACLHDLLWHPFLTCACSSCLCTSWVLPLYLLRSPCLVHASEPTVSYSNIYTPTLELHRHSRVPSGRHSDVLDACGRCHRRVRYRRHRVRVCHVTWRARSWIHGVLSCGGQASLLRRLYDARSAVRLAIAALGAGTLVTPWLSSEEGE